jgi:competence protein ComEA
MAGINFKSVIPNLFLALLLALTVNAQAPAAKINLNTANSAQLETLPGIGAGLAKRILDYRAKHGPFKRPQDLIVIRGFSAKRYRMIAAYVTT